jgi:hypothetical protein
MNHHNNAENFHLESDALDSYIESEVGVVHFKDKVFELSLDFRLQSILFDRIRMASESDEIKVLLMMSGASSVGEKKNYEFLRKVVNSLEGAEDNKMPPDVDPAMALSRVDSTLNQFILGMLQYNKFVVMAIRGSVVTELLGTMLAGDYRIASEDTVFSFPYFKYGLPPRGAIGYLLPKYVGLSKAKEILLRGKSIDAAEAKELNLIDAVIPSASFEKGCLEIARQFTNLPPNVISMTKKLLASDIAEIEKYLKIESELTNIYQVKLPPEPENG